MCKLSIVLEFVHQQICVILPNLVFEVQFMIILFSSLPARTSIIAAANPCGGHYNKAKTVSENLRYKDPKYAAVMYFIQIMG